jgi:hypothetical protein
MLTVKHKYLGFISQLSIFTLISPIDKVQNWNSDLRGGDHDLIMEYLVSGTHGQPLNSVFPLKISDSSNDWLIFNPLSKSIYVFKTHNSIALLSIDYMDKEWNDDFSEMEFEAAETPFMELPNFGGPIAIFDALMPGPDVTFTDEGLYVSNTKFVQNYPDTAIIHVEKGDYQVRDIMFEEEGKTKWEGVQIFI